MIPRKEETKEVCPTVLPAYCLERVPELRCREGEPMCSLVDSLSWGEWNERPGKPRLELMGRRIGENCTENKLQRFAEDPLQVFSRVLISPRRRRNNLKLEKESPKRIRENCVHWAGSNQCLFPPVRLGSLTVHRALSRALRRVLPP